MDEMVLDHRIQLLYNSTAKELYNLALNIFGNNIFAFHASIDVFLKAFVKMRVKKNSLDSNLFKQLSIRFLYKYGKKSKIRMNAKSHTQNGNRHELHTIERIKLLKQLDQLDYNERFIVLLFCCHKLRIEHISHILRLPRFLVTRWLLSASHKIALYNQGNNTTL